MKVILYAVSFAFLLSLCTVGCGRDRVSTDGTTTPDSGTTQPDNTGTTDNNNVTPDQGNNTPDQNNTTPDKTPDKGPPPKTACVDILTCAKKCTTSPRMGCFDTCAAPITGAGKQRWTSLKTCLETKCIPTCNGDIKCENDCLGAYCAKEWIACATDEKPGTEACSVVAACFRQCAQGDDACQLKCISTANAQAQTAYAGVWECAGKEAINKLPPNEKEACSKKTLACFCPQLQPGTGAGTCAAFSPCIEKCKSDDVCCVQRCRASMSANALKNGDAMLTCILANCKHCKQGDKNCTDSCASLKCTNTLQACICPQAKAPGSGGGKCVDGLKCLDKCAVTDTCCTFKCIGNMSASSYKTFQAFAECLPTCGCKGTDKKCVQKCSGFGGKCFSRASRCAQR